MFRVPKKWEMPFGIFLGLITATIIILGTMWATDLAIAKQNSLEVASYRYDEIDGWVEDCPALKISVKKHLWDDKITNGEYNDIKREYRVRRHRSFIERWLSP